MTSDAPGEPVSQPPLPDLGNAVADATASTGDDAASVGDAASVDVDPAPVLDDAAAAEGDAASAENDAASAEDGAASAGGQDPGSPDARAARVDAVAGAAVELARAAALEVGGDQVGDHLGTSAVSERVVEHTFAATVPGYRGWYWSVVVARASRSRVATVDEVVLLPGGEALRAPDWVPWAERIRPGDLGAGDLLPSAPDDDRLVPAYADDDMVELAFEVGLGRPRVLSLLGRLDAADRWLSEGNGPETPMARQAPGHCGTCGFLVPLAGSLRAAFGVCANAFAAADAQVVAVDYGCGAHSEAALESSGPAELAPAVVYDDAQIILEGSAGEVGTESQSGPSVPI